MNCKDCVTKCPMNGSDRPMCISVETTPEKGFRFRYESKASQTNAEYIRAMSDEELAKWLCTKYRECEWCTNSDDKDIEFGRCFPAKCVVCALDWLRQEVTSNG